MKITCPSCKCDNTVEGDCTFRGPASAFTPDGLKFFTLDTMVALSEKFHACLECGHVWSSINPEELKNLIKGSAKSKENLIL